MSSPHTARKGVTLAQIGRHDMAVGCFERAIFLKPDSAHMRTAMGIMLINLGKYGEAVKCIDGAIKISPLDSNAHIQKAYALEKMGSRVEAIECCKKMLGWKKLGEHHSRRARDIIDRLSAG